MRRALGLVGLSLLSRIMAFQITVNVVVPPELAGKTGKALLYVHDKMLADAPAGLAAEKALSMKDETLVLEADPNAEQVGKKAADMIQPAYYLSISGDVFADPAFSLSNGQVVTVTLRARSS
ncbi:unnamed protein product [Effrenium voratum]|uniref:Uncharacterized protein n=2 Tax=Effrenium voratum TaxID=2562239 RepID=A0AA36NDU4_9DINO|nr:unnamed protein product [Effrenium voratum]